MIWLMVISIEKPDACGWNHHAPPMGGKVELHLTCTLMHLGHASSHLHEVWDRRSWEESFPNCSEMARHIYTYIYTYIYIVLYIYIYTHTYIYIHIHIHIHIPIYIYIHTHTYMHACMHTYIHNTYIHTYIYTYTHIHIYTYTHTYTHTYTYTYTYTYRYRYRYTYTYIHTCIHMYVYWGLSSNACYLFKPTCQQTLALEIMKPCFLWGDMTTYIYIDI